MLGRSLTRRRLQLAAQPTTVAAPSVGVLGKKARVFRFAHFSLAAIYRRKALGELRAIGYRARACDARLVARVPRIAMEACGTLR